MPRTYTSHSRCICAKGHVKGGHKPELFFAAIPRVHSFAGRRRHEGETGLIVAFASGKVTILVLLQNRSDEE